MRKRISKKDFSHLKPGMVVGIKPEVVIGVPRLRGREAKVIEVDKKGFGYFVYLDSDRRVRKESSQVYLLDSNNPIEKSPEELSKLPTEVLVKMLESIK